jgi:hypothetical protein
MASRIGWTLIAHHAEQGSISSSAADRRPRAAHPRSARLSAADHDRHWPGPDHCAAHLEVADRFEVELVAFTPADAVDGTSEAIDNP